VPGLVGPNRLNDRGQAPIAGTVFKRKDGVVRVRGRGSAGWPPDAIGGVRMFGGADLLAVLGARGRSLRHTRGATVPTYTAIRQRVTQCIT
jgi:hypothetical protein